MQEEMERQVKALEEARIKEEEERNKKLEDLDDFLGGGPPKEIKIEQKQEILPKAAPTFVIPAQLEIQSVGRVSNNRQTLAKIEAPVPGTLRQPFPSPQV